MKMIIVGGIIVVLCVGIMSMFMLGYLRGKL